MTKVMDSGRRCLYMSRDNTEERMAVGVFDSGLGGLTVHQAIARRMPDLPLVYLATTPTPPMGCAPRTISMS